MALYAPLIGWGMPYATGPDRTKTFATDEILPLEALAEMHNTFVVSKPDRNYGYPWWHYFVLAMAQAPYMAFLLLSGQLQGGTPQFPFGLLDPVSALQNLTLIGRGVSVAMGAGIVIAAYHFSRTLWGPAPALVAAVLTMLNHLMFYYSRTGNLDVPAFFWSALGLVVFARVLVHGVSQRRAVWVGIFAGFAMATKDQSAVLFLPLGAALMVPSFHPHGLLRGTRTLLAGLAAALATYFIATGMLVDPQRHLTHVHALLLDPSRITGAAAYWPPHPHTWTGTFQLLADLAAAACHVFSLPVLIAALAGICLTARVAPRRLILLLPLPAFFLLVYLPTRIIVMRYLLPLTLVVDSFAAFAVVSLRDTRWHQLCAPTLVLLCGWRLLVAADLTYAQYYDTRYPAAAWVRANIQPGEMIEYFGVAEVLPPLPATVPARRVAGRVRWVGESNHGAATLQYLATQGPEFLIVVPDWTSKPGMPHSGDCPPEVYAALTDGTAGYRQVAYFPSPYLLPPPLQRAPLDNPSVAPPVRIFARQDVAPRIRPS